MEDLAKDCGKDGVYEFMFVNACPKIIRHYAGYQRAHSLEIEDGTYYKNRI